MIVSVDDFTGTDVQKLNAAFSYIRALTAGSYEIKLVIPPRLYQITASVNATGIEKSNWSIEADGAVFHGSCTGKAMFDFLGSRWFSWRGGVFVGDETARPSVGLQYGRCGDGAKSYDCQLFTYVAFKGFYSKAAIYNLGAESDTLIHVYIDNQDTSATSSAIIIDGATHFGVTSDFVETPCIGRKFSCIQHKHINCNYRKYGSGPVWKQIHTNQVECQGYMVTGGSHAVEIFSSTPLDEIGNTGGLGLSFSVHVEFGAGPNDPAPASAVKFSRGDVDTLTIDGFKWHDIGNHARNQVFEKNDDLLLVDIHGADIEIDHYLTPVKMFSADTGWTVTGRITAPKLDLASATFHGLVYVRDKAGSTFGPGMQQIISPEGFDIPTEWKAYAPAIDFGAGAGFTIGAYQARYMKQGKTVFWRASVHITAIGTGGLAMQISLPPGLPCMSGHGNEGIGREKAATGATINVDFENVTAVCYPSHVAAFTNGALWSMSGFYETA
ncbi:hypothetical protein AS593_21445 [Caulobacter vibrioides]|nr:hypothetical protein AS593_21445 [Caulobacter vibrioides]